MSSKKNILVITYWSYKDALIQAYTLPYLRIMYSKLVAGSKIFLVTFEQENQQISVNERAQVKQRLRMQGIRLITLKYSKFQILSVVRWIYYLFFLTGMIIFQRINFIHAWCTPAGSIGYILSKITGRKLIIDSYEPHADAMVENKTWSKESLQFKILFSLEKRLTKHASIIISATRAMYQYAKDRYGVSIENFYVKPACVDQSFFAPKKRKNQELLRQLNLEDKIICIYAGKFGGIYLTKEVFDFFKVAQDYWGDEFRCLILTSHPKSELKRWAAESGFNEQNMIIRFEAHQDVPEFMGLGDFAITPVKPIPSKRYCTPIKDGEYWALGLPVVITKNISDDSDLIRENEIGAVLDELDHKSYKNACIKIDQILKQYKGNELQDKIRDVAYRYRSYAIAENIYRDIYGNEAKP